jgi:hypothetical protein
MVQFGAFFLFLAGSRDFEVKLAERGLPRLTWAGVMAQPHGRQTSKPTPLFLSRHAARAPMRKHLASIPVAKSATFAAGTVHSEPLLVR